jgi:hypothetical protein
LRGEVFVLVVAVVSALAWEEMAQVVDDKTVYWVDGGMGFNG